MELLDKISVIIPTYNRAKLLPKALESALAQTHKNMQIIVADDASSDETSEVMQPYLSDPRVTYYKNKVNLGCHPNIRKALYEFSNGKYCFILCDDNYLIDSDFFRNALDTMKRHGSKLLFSNHVTVFMENEKTKSIKEFQNLPQVNSGEYMYFRWKSPIFLNSQTNIFDCEYAKQFLNPYDKDIVFADHELWLRFFLSPGCKCSFLKCHSIAFLAHFNAMTIKQSLENFIDGLVWCTSTEELATKQFGRERVRKHVDFLLSKSLVHAVGPIVTFRNIFHFIRLLKVKNPRAFKLFWPALLKNPSRIIRLFISSIPPLYLASIRIHLKWRFLKAAFVK